MEEPKSFKTKTFMDSRGWFMESYNRDYLRDELGIENDWMQDNLSRSRRGVIRGIHYQLDGQAKLVRCISGRIVDVVVDLRKDSRAFGKAKQFYLSDHNGLILYVPPGFGHSFMATEESIVMYKVDKPWNKDLERGIRFNDTKLDIPWRELGFIGMEFILSAKDKHLPAFKDADLNFKETD